MKLIGSRTEDINRRELVNSALFIRGRGGIINFLTEKYGEVRSAYALSDTPEQGKNIYRILVNGAFIVGFELSMEDGKISDVFECSVLSYLRELKGRSNRLHLTLALELANR
ncbi:hypothetical protein [Klebsiella spallanzanii]|uniref:hypothetical protein n=1 Tax=Klebsiella spallanzanii TaxID=2587528 RepID=UPI00111B1EE9|nr:hypothetical protein [Klebsiella spallanzanii]